MLELVLVIVVLGILAVIALTKIGASRDDAKAVMIKKDIESTKSFLGAHATAEDGVETLDTAIQLDENKWLVHVDGKQAVYNSENDNVWCVRMEIIGLKNADQNLSILINEENHNRVCLNLHERLGMETNQSVRLKGEHIKY